ncbi:ORF81 [Ranid herpesvirus 1]|uniref:ORF81 n=1 Tax=Ranid herpesvirus 1 TaxID=85655 RepID=Q9YQY7_9VIRU|nr:ORF81 [Ranid herpesvirus 1]AAD12278.1 ORF81 [Ranid herpesvirus 1]
MRQRIMVENDKAAGNVQSMLAAPSPLVARICGAHTNPWIYATLTSTKGAMSALAFSEPVEPRAEPAHTASLGKRAKGVRRARVLVHWVCWVVGTAFHVYAMVLYGRCFVAVRTAECNNSICYTGFVLSMTTVAAAAIMTYGYLNAACGTADQVGTSSKNAVVTFNFILLLMFMTVYAYMTHNGVVTGEPQNYECLLNQTVTRGNHFNGTVLAWPATGTFQFASRCTKDIYYTATVQIVLWCCASALSFWLDRFRRELR